MYNSVFESNRVSQEIKKDTEKFLSDGGFIESVEPSVSSDVASIKLAKKTAKQMCVESKEERIKKIRSEETRDAKRLRRAEMAYRLRQYMQSDQAAQQMGIGISCYRRLLRAYKDHCESKGMDYQMPIFRDVEDKIARKHAKEEKVAKWMADGRDPGHFAELMGVTRTRVLQIYSDYKKAHGGGKVTWCTRR